MEGSADLLDRYDIRAQELGSDDVIVLRRKVRLIELTKILKVCNYIDGCYEYTCSEMARNILHCT